MTLFLWLGQHLSGNLGSFLLHFILNQCCLSIHRFLELYREKAAGKGHVYRERADLQWICLNVTHEKMCIILISFTKMHLKKIWLLKPTIFKNLTACLTKPNQTKPNVSHLPSICGWNQTNSVPASLPWQGSESDLHVSRGSLPPHSLRALKTTGTMRSEACRPRFGVCVCVCLWALKLLDPCGTELEALQVQVLDKSDLLLCLWWNSVQFKWLAVGNKRCVLKDGEKVVVLSFASAQTVIKSTFCPQAVSVLYANASQ